MPISQRRLLLAFGIAVAIALPARAGSYRWTTSGPQAGHVFQIVVSPEDPNIAFASVGFWGPFLFRTVDRGTNWVQQDALIGGGPLLAHPSDSRILYKIGWAEGRHGVLKSTDGGLSWPLASSGLPTGLTYSAIALAPSSPQILYVVQTGNPAKVFRSGDGAATWVLATDALPQTYGADLEVDPSNPSILYLASYPDMLKSEDSGATWNPTGTLPAPTLLRIVPSVPSTIYAGTNDAGVYKSVDGGQVWTPANTGIANHAIRDLAIDPANPEKLFAATDASAGSTGGLFVTTSGGQSWAPVDLGQPQNYASAVTIYPPDSSIIYAAAGYGGQRGGIFRSADGGQTWELASQGLAGFFSSAVAPHPVLGDVAAAVSLAKVFGRDSTGDWTLRGSAPYSLTSLVSDPSNGDVLWGAFGTPEPGGDGVVRSGDGGATWTPATNGLSVSQMHRLAIAPSDPQRLLAATFDGVFGTSNAGGLWAPLLSGDIRVAAFDSGDPDILYAGLFGGANQAGLLRSDDGGGTWSGPAGIPSSYVRVTDIAVPRDDPSSVYVADTNSGVHRSLDRGLSFSAANTGLPGIGFIRPVRFAADPSAPATLYLYGDLGGGTIAAGSVNGNVFRTNDGADTWTALPGFIPTITSIQDFAVSADGRIVYAATTSGVFQFERFFLDVPEANLFWTAVDAAAMNGVTSGCGAGRFCPSAALSRAAVSVFLLRGKNGAGYAPPPATGTVFGDVPAGSPAAGFIEELFQQGISAGCGGGNYCPGAALTRAAMAILVLKTKHGSAYTPPTATGAVFSDVPAGAFAADWIEQLHAEGITAGCGSGNFCPNDPLSRAQAAALVVRAFGLS